MGCSCGAANRRIAGTLAGCAGAEQDKTAQTDREFLLTYPNLANPGGELLFENEHVVLQRFVVNPGEWEGIHAHPGNQVYIHIRGGIWSARRGGEELSPSAFSATGSAGWVDTIDLEVGHESVNTVDTTIDLVWVTLRKSGDPAADVELI